jgi:hypothetical protein
MTFIRNKVVSSWLVNIYKNQICGQICDAITYTKIKSVVRFVIL